MIHNMLDINPAIYKLDKDHYSQVITTELAGFITTDIKYPPTVVVFEIVERGKQQLANETRRFR